MPTLQCSTAEPGGTHYLSASMCPAARTRVRKEICVSRMQTVHDAQLTHTHTEQQGTEAGLLHGDHNGRRAEPVRSCVCSHGEGQAQARPPCFLVLRDPVIPGRASRQACRPRGFPPNNKEKDSSEETARQVNSENTGWSALLQRKAEGPSSTKKGHAGQGARGLQGPPKPLCQATEPSLPPEQLLTGFVMEAEWPPGPDRSSFPHSANV